ncbi:MAG: hypothetical protein PHS05_02205 [Bacteroidales bacterium]|nr:hypothetical protein [Bacteroidales bacterium]
MITKNILTKITLTGKLPLSGERNPTALSGFLLCGGFSIGGY